MRRENIERGFYIAIAGIVFSAEAEANSAKEKAPA